MRFHHHLGVFLNKRPIFLYQMGKVGSTSLEVAFQSSGVPVHHIHSLGGDFSDQFRFHRTRLPLRRRIENRLFGTAQRLLLNLPNRPARVLTLVREPLARNLSAFFQLLRNVIWEDSRFNTRDDRDLIPLLTDAFHRYFRQNSSMTWIDREIRGQLGIDLYSHLFDPAQGWMRIRQRHIDLLVVRAENLDQCVPVISQFTGIAELHLPKVNLSDRKWYGTLYRDFRESYVPSPALLDELYDTLYMRHFYSAEETARFRQQWLKQPVADDSLQPKILSRSE